MSTEIKRGRVKWFSKQKGFLTIDGDERDIFVHSANVLPWGRHRLQILFQGSVVEFETTHNKDLGNMARPCAINVKVLQLQVPIQFELRNVANLTESEEKSFIDGIRTASLIDCTSEIKVVVTDKERKRGTVKDFDYGFGFIEPDDLGEELFVHKTQVLTGHRKLFSGQRVEFSTGERGGRSVAINVEVLEGDSPPLQPNRVPLVSS